MRDVYHLRGPVRSGYQRTMCGLVLDPLGAPRASAPRSTTLPNRVTCWECKEATVGERLEQPEYNTLDTGEPNDP